MLSKTKLCNILIYFLLLNTLLWGENQNPIVFVHGFLGWGPEEMGKYKYWGGFQDLEKHLESKGYTVFTVSIGPITSNWERAVEIFYQLKGGQVDYGEEHAQRWRIIQRPEGKTYSGLYPEWDEEHPVHVIGHSMGGQTARMLAHLLNNVYYTDSTGAFHDKSILLGRKNTGWIKSITSIGTPHNGTTLTDIVKRSVSFLQYFVGLAGVAGSDFYNFDMEHWDFRRGINEPWLNYFRRVREHPAWDTQNFSAWELNLNGAKHLNSIIAMDPDIYYYSYALSATNLDTTTGYHIPMPGINLILQAKARRIGAKTAFWSDGTATDSTWYENDGVVNTCSQWAPLTGLDGPEPIAEYKADEPPIPGQWYAVRLLKVDHWSAIGQGLISTARRNELFQIFEDHCRILQSLPKRPGEK
jgi:triacylglycerol lipase